MRAFRPLIPSRELHPNTVRLFKEINDYLLQVEAALANVQRGDTPGGTGEDLPGSGVTDHGELDGLVSTFTTGGDFDDPNDDHSQYAFLKGRIGGQSLFGSRNATGSSGWEDAGTVLAHGSAIAAFTGGSITFDDNVPVGNVIILAFSSYSPNNNYGGTSGTTSAHTSITDSAGNTWTKHSEFTSSEATGLRENTLSIWTTIVTSAITGNSTTITCSVSHTVDAGAITSRQFNVTAGLTLSRSGGIANKSGSVVDYPLLAVGGVSGDSIFIRAVGVGTLESNNPGFVASSAFTEADDDAESTNPPTLSGCRMEFVIRSTTGASSKPSETIAQYHANSMLAFSLSGAGIGSLFLSSFDDTCAASIDMTGDDMVFEANTYTFKDECGSNTFMTIDEDGVSFVVKEHLLTPQVFDDVVDVTVARGSLIYGNTTPMWDELTVGAAGTILKADGTDVAWGTLAFDDLSDVDIPSPETLSPVKYDGSDYVQEESIYLTTGEAPFNFPAQIANLTAPVNGDFWIELVDNPPEQLRLRYRYAGTTYDLVTVVV